MPAAAARCLASAMLMFTGRIAASDCMRGLLASGVPPTTPANWS